MKYIKASLVLSLLILFSSVVLSAPEVFAQQAGELPPPPSFGEVLNRMIPMFVVVFFIFYFLVMKPQQSKLKAHQALLSSMKRGDEVVTTSGLIGRVAGNEKDYILLEIAQNVRVKVEAAHVVKKYEAPAPEVLPADKKAKAS